MDFLTQLRHANIARDTEWNPKKLLSLSFRGNELGGEIGEAQNVLKKLERERLGLVGSRATTEQLGEELADGFICLDLIAMEFDLTIQHWVAKKFNKTSRERGLSIMLPEG
jgi:NTP pyrophosphatase (non-canonical NTP hydrolase)